MTRFTLTAENVHHAMSGHGGDCTPIVKKDSQGEWVRYVDAQRVIAELQKALFDAGRNKCDCGKPGTLRVPALANLVLAAQMAYYSCQPCFDATWGPEGDDEDGGE